MKVGTVLQDELGTFESLLLTETTTRIQRGETFLTLGLTEEEAGVTIAAGALSGRIEKQVFVIHSFYVAPAYRRKGGATLLLEELRNLLTGTRTKTVSVSHASASAEYDLLERFLIKKGFMLEKTEGDALYETTLSAIDAAGHLNRGGTSSAVISFADTDDYRLRKLTKEGRVSDAPMPQDGLTGARVDRDVSMLLTGEGEKGYLVIEQLDQQSLSISGIWHNGGNPVCVLTLLQAAMQKCREKYPPEEKLFVPTASEVSEKLLNKLIPDAKDILRKYIMYM